MAKVNFIRRHTDVEVDEEPIVDGNFIVTGDGNIYIDYGLERIKIIGGVVAEVVNTQTESDTDVYSCNYINNLNAYSTEEKRVGTWIDGKPLYSKIVSFETSDNMNVNLNIQLSNIDTIFIDESSSFIINDIETLGVNWYYAPTDWIRTWYSKRQELLRSKSPSSLGVRTAYITLKYTKTTD